MFSLSNILEISELNERDQSYASLAIISIVFHVSSAWLIVTKGSFRWLMGRGGPRVWWAAITACLLLTIAITSFLSFGDRFAREERQYWHDHADEHLRQAALDDDVGAISDLIEHKGAKLDEPDEYGATALHIAAHVDSERAIRRLLEAGARIELRDAEGRTALSIAASEGAAKAVRVLLSLGADPDTINDLGWTPLHAACTNGHHAVVDALIKSKVDLHARVYGRQALSLATRYGYQEIVSLLLGAGADVNDRSSQSGETALHRSTRSADPEVALLLLASGAEVNAQDNDGSTALHLAAWGDHAKVAEVLLRHGADKRLKNKSGETPLATATIRDSTAVIEILR